MKKQVVDISTFTRDDHYFPPLDLLLTVKSFDLQAIRQRYLASKKNVSGKAGSVERRKAGLGGIISLHIRDGQLREPKILAKIKEPRGIHVMGSALGIAAENTVYIMDNQGLQSFTDPWFSYIHTLSFSPHDPAKILIASSGLDCIFELDRRTGHRSYAWFAWENGFDQANDPATNEPIWLTRDPDKYRQLKAAGKRANLIHDPENQVLPTAMRAAFINSVSYSPDPGKILATFFHEGAVYEIDRSTGKASPVVTGLKTPHGGMVYGDGYLATSTGSGEVVFREGDLQTHYQFSNLPGKPGELGELEWLQNSFPVDDFIITIDSNRTAFILFNPQQKVYARIPYDPDWAIQDLIPASISDVQVKMLKEFVT